MCTINNFFHSCVAWTWNPLSSPNQYQSRVYFRSCKTLARHPPGQKAAAALWTQLCTFHCRHRYCTLHLPLGSLSQSYPASAIQCINIIGWRRSSAPPLVLLNFIYKLDLCNEGSSAPRPLFLFKWRTGFQSGSSLWWEQNHLLPVDEPPVK